MVPGYDELYTITNHSPKSVSGERRDIELETSKTENDFRIDPSVNILDNKYEDDQPSIEATTILEENHVIVARSADPTDRASRSINIEEIPSSNNNDIDNNDIELHNKRKYYQNIHPTKTIDYLHERNDEEIVLSSNGFGDRFSFKFPGEAGGVPKARALPHPGPRIQPTVVQPIFATANPRIENGRQNNPEIQNLLTGLAKLLNGNVNVQANTQLNLRPGRPMASRINNRGPPRISEVAPLPVDFDKTVTPAVHVFHRTKTPPPYPFDRPPYHGVNLPEQIVPPMSTTPYRPGFHRPNLPPWHRPRPRPPPGKRPLPIYKPTPVPIHHDISIDLPDETNVEDPTPSDSVSENETTHSENTILNAEGNDELTINLDETQLNDTNVGEEQTNDNITTTITIETTTSSTTTTNATLSSSTEKIELPETTSTTTSTTEKPKLEKPVKPDKEKKKDTPYSEKEKVKDKHKIVDEKLLANKTSVKNDTEYHVVLETSVTEKADVSSSSVAPTPVAGLTNSETPTEVLPSVPIDIKTSSISPQLSSCK